MTSQPLKDPRSEHFGEIAPTVLTGVASSFSYPPTPEISREVGARLQPRGRSVRAWQLAVMAIAVLMAALFAVPKVRAFIGQYFRVGVVRIFPFGPTETPTDALAVTPASSPTSPSPTPQPLPLPLVNLKGLTTLEDAQRSATFPVLLPGYPPDLGPPDYAFYQGGIPMLIFVWADPDDQSQLRLSLFEIDSRSPTVSKFEPQIIQETNVNGQYALWVEGPYVMELTDQDYVQRYLVEGGTLVWEANGVTYRLETRLSLEEAVRIAESLQSMEP